MDLSKESLIIKYNTVLCAAVFVLYNKVQRRAASHISGCVVDYKSLQRISELLHAK